MLTHGGITRTWAETYDRARRVARSLAEAGVEPGSRVAFLDRNSIEYFEVFFGCALLGAVSVALNWRLAPAEMAAIIEDAGAEVLIWSSDYDDAAAIIRSTVDCVSTWVPITGYDAWLQPDRAEADDPGFDAGDDDVVTQLYTSGTTGLPKGVMISGKNIETILSEAVRVFTITADTVSMVAMPLFHIGGTGWAISGMSQGGHSIILRDVDPAEILRLISTYRITETFIVPAVLMFLLATEELATTDVSSLRTIFYGASPISEDVLVKSMAALGCNFAQVYGLTETTGAITSLMPEDHDPNGGRANLLRSAGRPFDHVELQIRDTDTGEVVAPGVVGEVWTLSNQNMLGYWNKPDETAAVIVDGWFRTGDAGWMSDDCYLFLHDRIKDMVVSGGENIYPAEVENALLAHPGVADAAVIGVPDDKWGETVKAIVVRSPAGASQDEADLARDIMESTRERLARYKCPTSVDFVDVLPRNASGKILKRELRAPFWEGKSRNIS